MNDETRQRWPMMADAIGYHKTLAKVYSKNSQALRIYNGTAEEIKALLTYWEETQWRPIETAPKDGEAILLFDNEDGPIVGYAFTREDPHSMMWISFHDIGHQVTPTHWMPLPKGPQRLENKI